VGLLEPEPAIAVTVDVHVVSREQGLRSVLSLPRFVCLRFCLQKFFFIIIIQ